MLTHVALCSKSFNEALACDPISIGGIVSCNFKINKKIALELNKLFLEVFGIDLKESS